MDLPGYDDEIFAAGGHPMAPESPQSRWLEDPPAADERKVVISDTDHYAPGRGDALWAWKSFLQGHHPILMDFGIISGLDPADPGYAAFEAARRAMGDTRRFAERVSLIDMEPRGDLSSTGYALANPGKEYLVLVADQQPTCTVTLEPGTYSVEWFTIESRQTLAGEPATATDPSETDFRVPSSVTGPVVLYLSLHGEA
jgi:hypothetical protein